ncbi:nonstructural protein 1 [Pileated finch aveparvovirus]|uniref:Nonstructural protein 1 n=1 Tax=Pileated finch aveparvovirus TaxID=2137544 RepID=A0A2Z3D7B7_9VIRU|nr:nonstructural protein 1 [Pileated finch aveparvovirus]AVR53746.1 nonstructural protein 1 [Pileated finch aveparvovirus]
MAIPTSGAFSAVFMLPDEILLGNNEFSLRNAVNSGYSDPKSGEFIKSKFPTNHEFLEDIRAFVGDPGWSSTDLAWIWLHNNLISQALGTESKLNPSAKIFWQTEISKEGKVHVHIVFISGFQSRNISWTMKRIRRDICKAFSEIMNTFMPEFGTSQWWAMLTNISPAMLSLNRAYSPKLGKTVPQGVNPYAFLKFYLYNPKKTVLSRGGSDNIMDHYPMKSLDDQFDLQPDESDPQVPTMTVAPGDDLPLTYVSTEADWDAGGGLSVLKTGVMEKLCMEALRLCKEKMIFTEKDFKLEYPDKFLQFASRTRGIEKLNETIDLFVETITARESAWNIAKARMGEVDEIDLDNNLVVRLLTHQGYAPKYVGHLLVTWLSDKLGKKNTVYFFGPANTGKTMMAESICKMVGIYGNVNHNNENFPFNDCHAKAIIWWEECSMNEKYVEAAKCILGGSAVRVDRKGKDSMLVTKTPVVVTSNNDITVVTSRNSISSVHAAALRSRCMKFHFTSWLTSNWGLITPQMMYEFLIWAERLYDPTLDGILQHQPQFGDNIPFNQPRGEWCSDCSPQFTTQPTVTVCPTCTGWTRVPVGDLSCEYTGSEVELMNNLTEGKWA